MKLDPGIHIVKHLVFFGKSGVTKVHNHLTTHGSVGATEPGRDGPGSVGPSRLSWPTPGVSSPPFPCTRRIFNPKVLEVLPFAPRGHPQARERGGRSPEEDRPSRRKHPQVEKKKDTVGSVTMINGATSSTLMG
jgi:hypothetical protein